MTFLNCVLGMKMFDFFLMLFGGDMGGVSFGVYDIERSLTPLGWAVIIIFPIALIFGVIYLAARILKKTKIK